MRRMVMNVTPREFREIWEVWSGAMPEADAVAFMERYYGCERYTEYRVVVHYEAPCVPMLSWGLKRFEPEPQS